MQRLYINPEFESELAEAGLCQFQAFTACSKHGELVAQDGDRTTHRLQLGENTYYLKSVHKAILAPTVEALLTLRNPHHYCWREMQQVKALQTFGVEVMDVAAAGEKGTFGILDFSFILVPEVKGEIMADTFAAADKEHQLSLLAQLGTLVGRLHSGGFFAPIRMKDIIVDSSGQLVMIDRETRKPGARKFTRNKAIMGLSRTMWRQSRDGLRWDDEQLHIHLAAYLKQAPPELNLDEAQLKHLVQEKSAALHKN